MCSSLLAFQSKMLHACLCQASIVLIDDPFLGRKMSIALSQQIHSCSRQPPKNCHNFLLVPDWKLRKHSHRLKISLHWHLCSSLGYAIFSPYYVHLSLFSNQLHGRISMYLFMLLCFFSVLKTWSGISTELRTLHHDFITSN